MHAAVSMGTLRVRGQGGWVVQGVKAHRRTSRKARRRGPKPRPHGVLDPADLRQCCPGQSAVAHEARGGQYVHDGARAGVQRARAHLFRREEVVDKGPKPRPMWRSRTPTVPRPLGEERAQRIMEPYFPRGTSSTRWVIGVGCRSKANIPHCPLRLRAHSSHCHWQQGTKCSVRGGDAEITMSGRRAGICDLRVFASKVASKRSRHSAHPPSIGKLPSIIRW
jgi:hypothetical protein